MMLCCGSGALIDVAAQDALVHQQQALGSGVLRVRLPAGLRPNTDISLRFTLNDGLVEEKVYGFAMFWNDLGIRDNAFNYRIHKGRVLSQEATPAGLKVVVDMTVESDPWVKGGPAHYELLITVADGQASGQYTGQFHQIGAESAHQASGILSGTVGASVARKIPGHVPFEAEEHPRILVRKGRPSSLAEINDRYPRRSAYF